MKNNVKEKFNAHASQYDEQRRKLIPCFFDFYSIPVSLLHFSKSLFAYLILEQVQACFLLLLKKSTQMRISR